MKNLRKEQLNQEQQEQQEQKNENTKILENSNVSDLNEDELLWRHYSAIQCFLNRKGIKDNDGKPLVVDGSIGGLPNSKSAQALAKYQYQIKVPVDGMWGSQTMSKMPPQDLKIYKECVSKHGDIADKLFHFLGID